MLTELLFSEVDTFMRGFVDPNKRLFIGYLVGALSAALVVFYIQFKTFNIGQFCRYLFPKKLWWHPSAKLDYQLYVMNRIIRALLWAPIVLTMVPIAMALSSALEQFFGTIEPISQQAWVGMAIFTSLLFIFDDLSRFLLHLAMHKIPLLWEFHKVHHSAIVLTPMTIYRSHPLESFLYASRMAIAQGCAVGIGYYLLGTNLSWFDILGANVFIFLFNFFGSNLRHSHVKWRWPSSVEKWLISPVQHQIHHSTNPKHFDKNFGTCLAIWDRLFGSLVYSKGVHRLRFGIGKREPSHRNVVDVYARPFIACFHKMKQTKILKTPPVRSTN